MRDFQRFYEECKKFYANPDNVKRRIPVTYQVGDYKVGLIAYQVSRLHITLTFEQATQLEELGFVWHTRVCHPIQSFDDIYRLLKEYMETTHQKFLTYNYKTPDGIALGQIFYTIRSGRRKITEEQRKQLEELGISFEIRKKKVVEVEDIIRMLEEFQREYHHVHVRMDYITPKGERLGDYVRNLRAGYKIPTHEQRKRLDELGFIWRVRA